MDELILSLENLKQQLICSFCNELVCNPFKFIICSHIFCQKHLKSSQMKQCFTCHRGNVQDVMQDNNVNEMIKEYKKLSVLFKSLKENIKIVSTSPQAKTGKSSDEKKLSNEFVKPNTSKSPKKTISEQGENANTKKDSRILRNKQSLNEIKESDKNVKKPISANNSPNNDESLTELNKLKESPIKTKKLNTHDDEKPSVKSSEKIKKHPTKKVNKIENVVIPSSSKSNDSLLETSLNNSNKYLMKRNKKGESCLHSACVQNKLEEVKFLLEHGATPNTKDNAGWTPLHEAVASGNAELVQLLLKHGAYPQVPGPHFDTPLHEAVRLHFTDIAEYLVLGGASVHAKNDKGETPYSICTEPMKTTLHRVQEKYAPSQIDITFSTQNEDVFVVFPLSLKKNNLTKFQDLCKVHANLKIATEFSKKVSHLLIENEDGSCLLTQETLLAVVNGKPIISTEWLAACTNTVVADLKTFYKTHLSGSTECVHLSLMNKMMLGPGLFAGCHFYIVGFNSKYEISTYLTIKKPFLIQLITEGGGIILRREPNPESIPESERVLPYHATPGSALEHCAHYIIYQNKPVLAYNMKHIKALPVAWLIECVQNFRLVDP